jgi:hypothetical protein
MSNRKKISQFAKAIYACQRFFEKYSIDQYEFYDVMSDWEKARTVCITREQCGWCQRHVNCEKLSDNELEEYLSSAICPKCINQKDKPTIFEPEIH